MYEFYDHDESKYTSINSSNEFRSKRKRSLKRITHVTGHTTRTNKSRFFHESLSLSSTSMIVLDTKAPLKSLMAIRTNPRFEFLSMFMLSHSVFPLISWEKCRGEGEIQILKLIVPSSLQYRIELSMNSKTLLSCNDFMKRIEFLLLD